MEINDSMKAYIESYREKDNKLQFTFEKQRE
jgi:hypothetical protein